MTRPPSMDTISTLAATVPTALATASLYAACLTVSNSATVYGNLSVTLTTCAVSSGATSGTEGGGAGGGGALGATSTQSPDPAHDVLPAPQMVHVDSPAAENVPAAQGVQFFAPSTENVPAVQLEQALFPPAFLPSGENLPAAHGGGSPQG